jgi:hypothetical protein
MNYSCFNKVIVAPFVLAATVVFSVGCGVLSTEPYQRTTVYDLGVPKSINKSGILVSVGRLRTEGPYKFKMILRRSGNNLYFNDYTRWAQSPELMLRRYLKLSLGAAPNDTSRDRNGFFVTGTILVFEADESLRTVSLVVDYVIKRTESGKLLDAGRASFSTELTTVSSDSIAVAMSENTAKFADLIMKEINKMVESK